jgi:phosphoribosylformimino-5-aminoimidazole carboxamide ribotide isomerase
MEKLKSSCRIVPAIDLIEGRCVRLRRGEFDSQEVVGEDPVVVARSFFEQGFRRLHIVDLCGARLGSPRHLEVVKRIARETDLEIDFSGGLRSQADLQCAFDNGASFVTIGSRAITHRDEVCEWVGSFGSERVIIGLDVADGRVRIHGWVDDSGTTLSEVVEFYIARGVTRIMSTDIERDGMMSGPNFALYRELRSSVPYAWITASGGVSSTSDIQRLAQAGVNEVIVGKALYSGSIAVSDVSEFVW